MTTRERGNFEGAIHHIWQRGNNKEFIFENSKTKSFFINQLMDYNKKFDYNILAYVVMNNHYHLLMQTFKNPISEIMFNINNVTAKYIRDNLNRSGHVFQGRFNSKLVDSNEYFLWLIRYIHRNPVRAKICDNVGDYYWSSHNAYLRGGSNLVNVDLPLSMLSPDRKTAVMLYLELMNSRGSEESMDKDFELFEKQLSVHEDKETIKANNFELPMRTSFEEILDSFKLQPEEVNLITSGCRKRSLSKLKVALIKKALQEKYTHAEIASYFNISQPAVSKIIMNHK